MTKVTEGLEDIQNALRYKNFGSILDMATETLRITHVDTQTHFVIKEEIIVSDDSTTYSRTFDESNINFESTFDFNRIFLECQQRYLNHLLQNRGHLFLNEVYDALGFQRTSDGAIVGWIYKEDDEEATYIDFGLDSETKEKTIILEFNVQGVIYDKI